MKLILIASDHAGFVLKQTLATHLKGEHLCFDLGPYAETRVDYPDYAHTLCRSLRPQSVGILVCGTGIGMSIAANRHPHIRCAVAVTPLMASLARQHNNANVLALGARLLSTDQAFAIIEAFLTTGYEGGRHDDRLAKLGVS